MRRFTPLLVALTLLAAACGTDTGADETTPTVAAETTATTAAPPTTAATTTTEATVETEATVASTAAPAAEPALDADQQAIADAYAIAFNSESSFEDTLPFLVEPEGMEEVVAGYADIGDQMGGVSVEIESITVTGNEAAVVYTLLFGGNPTYSGLNGTAILTDAGWQLSREMFCGLMTSARVGCPDA